MSKEATAQDLYRLRERLSGIIGKTEDMTSIIKSLLEMPPKGGEQDVEDVRSALMISNPECRSLEEVLEKLEGLLVKHKNRRAGVSTFSS